MINAIVRPDIYERDRVAIRGEPFLWIKGKLAKDDGSLNVIAEEVRGLHCGLRIADRGLGTQPGTQSAIRNPKSAMALLKNLRSAAPDAKSWG
jgi:hypothetical protein